MHATIQKPIDEIIGYLKNGEKVFIVGCGNCAEKCRSGGEEQVQDMIRRLKEKGVEVSGGACTASGSSLCKLSTCRKLFEENRDGVEKADSFIILACGQGIHTVMDATDGGNVHPGCDTIFGGETVNDDFITEYCSLCGECIVEDTGGLCPITLCSKGLLNGPCGGSKDGKCEVDKDKDCGWQLIYDRLKSKEKLNLMQQYQKPKNYARWSRPRQLNLEGSKATFKSLAGLRTVNSKTD